MGRLDAVVRRRLPPSCSPLWVSSRECRSSLRARCMPSAGPPALACGPRATGYLPPYGRGAKQADWESGRLRQPHPRAAINGQYDGPGSAGRSGSAGRRGRSGYSMYPSARSFSSRSGSGTPMPPDVRAEALTEHRAGTLMLDEQCQSLRRLRTDARGLFVRVGAEIEVLRRAIDLSDYLPPVGVRGGRCRGPSPLPNTFRRGSSGAPAVNVDARLSP